MYKNMSALVLLLVMTFTLSSIKAIETDPITSILINITVTHTSTNNWLVEYQFSQPIKSMNLGPAVKDYRQNNWEILSKELTLVSSDEGESIVSQNSTFDSIKLNLTHTSDYSMNNYAPSARFSDSGYALYLRFLYGSVIVKKMPIEPTVEMTFKTDLDEQILTPEQAKNGAGVYTYFGPQKMKTVGSVQLIVDPKMPTWLEKSFNKVVPLVSDIFTQQLKHRLSSPPQIMLASGDINTIDDFSVKGGANNNQIVMIYKGKQLLEPSKEKQQMLERLIAHEMVHLWQQNVTNGGMNGDEPWQHEGGAEVLAIAALVKAGIWQQSYADKYIQYYSQRCVSILGEHTLAEKTAEGNWDAVYACGYKNFIEMDVDIFDLWAKMITRANKTGELYSAKMIQTVTNNHH